MKKILIITPSFFPNLGGVERHVLETTNYLVRKKYSIKIITEQKNDSNYFEKKSGFEIYRFSYPKKKFLGLLTIWWKIFKRYYKFIKEADVIHIHDIFVWYLPFRLIFWRKPVVTTFHGWEGVFPLPQKNKLWRRLGVWLSNKTIAVGKYLEKYYSFKADLIIYGGVHVPKNRFEKEQLLLYVGRLNYDTGLPILLRSLRDNPWKGKVVFCGDGVLKDQASMFGEVVGFRNPIPYLKKAKIVFAGGYLSILEAFAYRCLVIAAYGNPLKRDYFSLSPMGRFIQMVKTSTEVSEKIDFSKRKNKFNENKLEQAYQFTKDQSWQKIATIYEEIYKKY
jgi:glycosyltransferase involved in cell wall biosynthesis